AAALFYIGRTEESYVLARRIRPSVPLARLSDEDALGLWSKVAIDTGRDWAEVDAWMTVVLDDAVKLGDHAAAGLAALTRGRLRRSGGRFAGAARCVAGAGLQFEQGDGCGALAATRAGQVLVACARAAPDVPERMRRCRAALDGREPLP